MTPEPARFYVAKTGYVSEASKQHLPAPGTVRGGMKLRGDHPVVAANPEFWIDASEDPDTAALAAAVAERLRGVPTAETAEPRRGPGRRPWTRERFWPDYRAARTKLGPGASDKEIAAEFGFGEKQLSRLVGKFGRPAE